MKKMLVDLSFIETIQLKINLFICDCTICQSYQKYSELIDKAVDEVNHERQLKQKLSPQKKQEILDSLKG